MPTLNLTESQEGCEFTVKVVPGSSRTLISGIHNGMLKVKVSAAPEKGKANKALIDFLAERLSVKKNDIVIVSGLTNPVKHLRILGLTCDSVRGLCS